MSNFLKILIILMMIVLFYQQQKIYDANWCSSEIEVLKMHLSDIWYMYNLDELTIEKGK
jgi:hypothetical protein